ncbi:MAG: TMEM165/GDT1 family protein [Angustibacter sp.]
MFAFLTGAMVSFAVVFLAEFGDKSQLMALAFAARFRAMPVLLAITAATAVVHLASVVLGYGLGAALPTDWLTLGAALAFFGFAAWTIRGDRLTEDEQARAGQTTRSVVITVGIAFFLAELGDKTMLATMTLATDYDPWGTWIGSTLGMVVADALAIALGRTLGKRLPERAVRWSAAGSFFVFGVVLSVQAVVALAG